MKFAKIIIPVVLLFVVTFSGLSRAVCAPAGATVLSENDLARLFSFYTDIVELEAKFRQIKHIKDIDIPLRSEGTLKIQRPHGVIWTVTKPSWTRVELTEGEIKIESGEGRDRTVQTFKQSKMPGGKAEKSLKMLVSWLKLDPHLIAQQYRVMRVGEREYEMVPMVKDESVFEKMKLKMTDDKKLQSLQFDESSGDSFTIEFDTPKVKRRPS